MLLEDKFGAATVTVEDARPEGNSMMLKAEGKD